MKLDPRHQRPMRLVESLQEKISDVWESCDMWREHCGRDGCRTWPSWCYLPIDFTMPIAMGDRIHEPATFQNRLIASKHAVPMAGLAAWRVTQGIWDFDETLYRELWDSPLEGDLPVELFYRLPEWAPYICLRGEVHQGVPLRGFFVWLENDMGTGRPELRLLLDTDATESASRPLCLTLYLSEGTIEECLQRVADDAMRELQEMNPRMRYPDAGLRDWLAEATGLLKHLLNLVLYLCSQEPDLTRRAPPSPLSYRKPVLRPPQQPTLWPVGLRIGAALRAARPSGSTEASEPTGRTVRAHIRRAHWHCYWIGARTAGHPGEKLELRWIPPVAVGIGQAVATVHPIAA